MQEAGAPEFSAPSGRMLGALLRIPSEAIVAQVYRALVDHGFDDLTPSHMVVFQHLSLRDGAHLTSLAEAAQMTKQSMNYLVDYLEAHGYLERVPDPRDGRARLISPTERGREVERVGREAIASIRHQWAGWVGEKRLDALESTLRIVVERLENVDG